MSKEPMIVADTQLETGEGPLWHPEDEVIYWIDIPNGELHAYDPVTDDHQHLYTTTVIGGFTIQQDGSLLLFEQDCVERWDHGDVETVARFPELSETRFNDVIAGPEGRVYAGVMPTDGRPGALYRFDVDGSFTRVVDGVDLPNGLGFTLDKDALYFTDTCYYDEQRGGEIYRYDYDRATGTLSNPTIAVDATDQPGLPDGMTIDEEGFIWSANWNGSCLVRYSPNGKVDRRIEFPARKVACPTFGGPDYETLYVATACVETHDEEGEGAGALFRVDTAAGGRPEFRSRIEV